MDFHRSLQGPGEGESISEPPLLTEHPVLDISWNVNKKLETVEIQSAMRSVTQGGGGGNAARISI